MRATSYVLPPVNVLRHSHGLGAKPKWSTEIDEFSERIESGKAAVSGAIAGSLAFAPVAYFTHAGNLAQFEFDTDMSAIEGALFAVVYRYAVREDENPQLKQGAVGAFVAVRILSRIQTSTSCIALPLRCGEPLSYFDWAMLAQLSVGAVESAAIFGAAAAAIEALVSKGWLRRFPS